MLISGMVSAQALQPDSLIIALERHPGHDTVRLKLLNDLSFSYYSTDPAQGIVRSQQAIALAQQLNSLPHLAAAYNNKGTNHWALGDDSLALEAFGHALEIHIRTGNRLGAAKAMNNLALNHYNLSDFRRALEYHGAALTIFEELKHTAGIVNSYSNSGVVYLSLSDYPRALENFLHAARFVPQGDSLVLANILLNLGLVHKNMFEYAEALRCTRDALGIYSRSGQKQGEANALGNLGTIYSLQGAREDALAHYTKALALNTVIGNDRRIASDLVNIGTLYQKAGDYRNALQHLKEGLRLYGQTNDKENTSFALVTLADVYLAAPSLQPGGDTGAAEETLFGHLRRALALAGESGSLQSQSAVWETLSRAYEKYGYHSKALSAFRNHIAYRDSIYNVDKDKEIARQQIRFEFEKKENLLRAEHEKSIALAHAEIKRKKAVEVAGLSGFALVSASAAIGYFLHRKRKDAERREKDAALRAMIADTRMKALRAQMNPHFIFNSLNAVSNLIANNDPAAADEYLTRFSRIIRITLENSEQKEVPLSEDLEALRLYLQLEQMRLHGRFVYRITVHEPIDPDNTMVPPLILQPLVENSVWHGVSGMTSNGKISIDISRSGDSLICIVEDNGPGRRRRDPKTEPAAKSPKTSLGVHLTRSRIDLLSNGGQSHADLDFTDLPSGLRATVSLPLRQKF